MFIIILSGGEKSIARIEEIKLLKKQGLNIPEIKEFLKQKIKG